MSTEGAFSTNFFQERTQQTTNQKDERHDDKNGSQTSPDHKILEKIKIFPSAIDSDDYFSINDITAYYTHYQDERLIIVTSFHPQAADYASISLVNHNDWDANLVKLDMDITNTAIDSEDFSLESLVKGNDYWQSASLLRIKMDEMNALSLIPNYLFFPSHRSYLKERLAEHEKWLLLQVPQNAIALMENDHRGSRHMIHIWEADFLNLISKKNNLTSTEKRVLIDQVAQGKWGKSNKEQYERLVALDADELKEHLVSTPASVNEAIKPNKPKPTPPQKIPPEMLFDQGPVEQLVTFIACWFHDLPYESFCHVVKTVLDRSDLKLPISKFKTDSPMPETLLDYWTQNEDRIRKRLYLRITDHDDGSEGVVFAKEVDLETFQNFFLKDKRSFLTKQLDDLKQSPLIFGSSIIVMDKAVELMIEMASRNREHYGKNWLFEILESIDWSEKVSNSTNDVYRYSVAIATHTELLGRLARIIRKMSRHEGLQLMIKQSLEYTVHKHHGQAFKLIKYLRNTPAIDDLYWLKLLIDNCNPDNIKEISNYFIQYVYRSGSDLVDVLTRLNDWFPSVDREIKNYSLFQGVLTRLAVDLILKLITDIDITTQQNKQLSFGGMEISDLEEMNKITDIFIAWVFHPGVRHELIDQAGPLPKNPNDWIKHENLCPPIRKALANVIFLVPRLRSTGGLPSHYLVVDFQTAIKSQSDSTTIVSFDVEFISICLWKIYTILTEGHHFDKTTSNAQIHDSDLRNEALNHFFSKIPHLDKTQSKQLEIVLKSISRVFTYLRESLRGQLLNRDRAVRREWRTINTQTQSLNKSVDLFRKEFFRRNKIREY